jgi:hypothetical protein
MKHYFPTGRRNYSRPLKRLLDTWERNGSTSGPTPYMMMMMMMMKSKTLSSCCYCNKYIFAVSGNLSCLFWPKYFGSLNEGSFKIFTSHTHP